jgi:hypothetical protein
MNCFVNEGDQRVRLPSAEKLDDEWKDLEGSGIGLI